MSIRMLPIGGATATANIPSPPFPAQRVYSVAPGSFIDVVGDMAGDAGALASEGFLPIGTSGPTSGRPTNNLKPGAIHVDTSLNLVVFWDGAAWRNPLTAAAV
jgi:hypothetical protein